MQDKTDVIISEGEVSPLKILHQITWGSIHICDSPYLIVQIGT